MNASDRGLTSMLSSRTSRKPSSSSSRDDVREERLRNRGLESQKSSCWIGGGEENWTGEKIRSVSFKNQINTLCTKMKTESSHVYIP